MTWEDILKEENKILNALDSKKKKTKENTSSGRTYRVFRPRLYTVRGFDWNVRRT